LRTNAASTRTDTTEIKEMTRSAAPQHPVTEPLCQEPWALATRIDRAALELVLLMESGFARKIKDESWQNYQHEYGSADGTETTIDLDTDLMRLATGGSVP
jgi:hypothetical protein